MIQISAQFFTIFIIFYMIINQYNVDCQSAIVVLSDQENTSLILSSLLSYTSELTINILNQTFLSSFTSLDNSTSTDSITTVTITTASPSIITNDITVESSTNTYMTRSPLINTSSTTSETISTIAKTTSVTITIATSQTEYSSASSNYIIKHQETIIFFIVIHFLW
ncbi:unnamed protein product [Rotaria magnacalcarata]|uniref:Uncharacterized protein n=1 Tax=Rotaria magnacalcarata TaxID=392030 RepID=A0A815G5N8_9BILA|nr:unnamed protein product [Rotaria magnacalcarata]